MICILTFIKGHYSIIRVSGAMVVVLCTSADNVLFFEPSFVKVSQRVSELQTPTAGLTLGWCQFIKRHNSVKPVG